MRLLVAIPCLNEAQTLGAVLDRMPKAIAGASSVDILVVDDGSTDATAELARARGAIVKRHSINRGVGEAFKTALDYALANRFDILVTIDADGQFAPEDIPKIAGPILEGAADFVTGSRFIDAAMIPDMPPAKLWGNRRMSQLISRLAGRQFYDVSCGFRAYSTEAMLNLNLHGKFTYTQETFLDLSLKRLTIKEVPVKVLYFADRQSRVANNLFSYAVKTSKIIFRTYRDFHPLRFFWLFAAGSGLVSLVFGSLFLLHFIQTGRFSGNLWEGFLGGFFATVALIFLMIGVVTDMFDRLRMNQEKILYQLKKQRLLFRDEPR